VTVRGEVAVRDEKFVETVGQTLAATTRRVTSWRLFREVRRIVLECLTLCGDPAIS
jgi:hypothetical protein